MRLFLNTGLSRADRSVKQIILLFSVRSRSCLRSGGEISMTHYNRIQSDFFHSSRWPSSKSSSLIPSFSIYINHYFCASPSSTLIMRQVDWCNCIKFCAISLCNAANLSLLVSLHCWWVSNCSFFIILFHVDFCGGVLALREQRQIFDSWL